MEFGESGGVLALVYLLFCSDVMLNLGIGFILGNELVCMGFVLKGVVFCYGGLLTGLLIGQ
jgi:hypothetical protein